MARDLAGPGTIQYSQSFEGDRGNYGWAARYDISYEGYLGITQFDDETSRVLLSPSQVRHLIEFIRQAEKRRARHSHASGMSAAA